MPGEMDARPQPAEATPTPIRRPWLTIAVMAVCVVVFLIISAMAETIDVAGSLPGWAWMPAASVWTGSYWSLLTSVFVHGDVLHLGFNLYWFWLLGRSLEQTIGRMWFGLLFVLSAFISSAFQLALSDETGIGLSGVVYALFGFMWASRKRFSEFDRSIHSRTIALFILWLFLCIVLTHFRVMIIANEAHVAGLIFGGLTAFAFATHYRRKTSLTLAGSMMAFAIVTLFWLPWSVPWLSDQAYQAHLNKNYGQAINHYTRIIALDPENGWAFSNRANAYHLIGEDVKAEADAVRAYELGVFNP